ncbi:hypothetical protein [Rothia dentocariosa]
MNKGFKIFQIVICLSLLMLLCIYLWSIIFGEGGLVKERGDEGWHILGDIVRNISGLLTFITAIFTAFILINTNNTRAKEAVNSEYRDQMQWACEKLEDKMENTYEHLFALELIGRYGENPPRKLSKLDIEINYRVQEAVLDFDAENGSNSTLNNAIAKSIAKIEDQVFSRNRLEKEKLPKNFLKFIFNKIKDYSKILLNLVGGKIQKGK